MHSFPLFGSDRKSHLPRSTCAAGFSASSHPNPNVEGRPVAPGRGGHSCSSKRAVRHAPECESSVAQTSGRHIEGSIRSLNIVLRLKPSILDHRMPHLPRHRILKKSSWQARVTDMTGFAVALTFLYCVTYRIELTPISQNHLLGASRLCAVALRVHSPVLPAHSPDGNFSLSKST